MNTARLLYSDFRLRAAPAGGFPAQRSREATGRAEHPIGGQPRFYAGAALILVCRPPVKADAPDVANTLLVMMPPGMMSVMGGKRTLETQADAGIQFCFCGVFGQAEVGAQVELDRRTDGISNGRVG